MPGPVPPDAPRLHPYAWYIVVVLSLFNFLLLIGILTVLYQRDSERIALNAGELFALNLAVLQAFVAAIGIGLAILGAVGFVSLRTIAIRRAESAAADTVLKLNEMLNRDNRPQVPDLQGLQPSVEGDREEEKGI